MSWHPTPCDATDERGSVCVLPAGHVGGHAGRDQLGLSRWHGTKASWLWVPVFIILMLLAAALLNAVGFEGIRR